MSKEENKEYADALRDGTKDFLDRIDTDTEIGQRVIKLIYGFARSGLMQCGAEARKVGAA